MSPPVDGWPGAAAWCRPQIATTEPWTKTSSARPSTRPGKAGSSVTPAAKGETRDAIETALDTAGCASRKSTAANGASTIPQEAVLLSLPGLNQFGDDRRFVRQGAGQVRGLGGRHTRTSARPASAPCPNCVVRRSAYVAPGVVLRQCRRLCRSRHGDLDTWSTVGSCAQIGNPHISGGVGIGTVCSTVQAAPVIVEDDCFIGARGDVAEGVVVEQGAVLAMGCFIGASTKIVDRGSGGKTFLGGVRFIPWWCRAACPARLLAGRLRPARRSPAASCIDASTSRRGARPRSTSCCGIEGWRIAFPSGRFRCRQMPGSAGASAKIRAALNTTRKKFVGGPPSRAKTNWV